MRNIRVILIFFVMTLYWSSSTVLANCTTSSTNVALGSVTSFVINSTSSHSSGTVVVNCGVTGLTLLSTNNVMLQLTSSTYASGNQAVLMQVGDSTDSIPIHVCTTSNCSSLMTLQGSTVTYSSSQLLSLFANTSFTLPIYIQTVTGQTVAAGTYSTTLGITTTWDICTSINLLGICLTPQRGSAVVPITVTLTVTNDCTTISAPAVNFGSAPLLNSFSSVSQTISVTCTKGSVYTVGINNGNNAVNGVRNMVSGSNLISYDIYQSPSNTRWGSSIAAQRWSSTNASSVNTNQIVSNYNYVATILGGQSTPPAGSYSDTLVVDLSF